MIVAAAILFAAVPEDQIVVLAQRLAETRVDWATRRRGDAMEINRCEVTQSSGDAELDAVVCEAMRDCAPHIPADARLGDPLTEFFACAEERRLALGYELFERRDAEDTAR